MTQKECGNELRRDTYPLSIADLGDSSKRENVLTDFNVSFNTDAATWYLQEDRKRKRKRKRKRREDEEDEEVGKVTQ